MKIKMTNVYNTQSRKKSIKELDKKAKQHISEIKKKILELDETVIFSLESINYVDWRMDNRGEDIRLYLNIKKTGRKITAREIYGICNNTCLRPCYF